MVVSASCGENKEATRQHPPLFTVQIGAGTSTTTRICPDHVTLDHIGVADSTRGRFVRLVFWALQLWRP